LNFEQRVLQFIGKNKLAASRGLIVVGVSGGADSMALLLALAALRHDLGVRLHAAHFNHKFRPEASRDERFVAEQCEGLNVPLTVGHRQGPRVRRLSEDEARRMRFGFFIKTAHALKAQSVALAHTRNDLAETVLMRLMRGSGLYGVRAILTRRSIEGVWFVRPLMGVDRKDVEDYLRSRKTPYCTDSTNFQTIYERNKIRHELLPVLAKEYNPRIINVLSDLAATAGEDYDFMSMQARKVFEKVCHISKRKITIELKGIRGRHPAIVRLVFRQMVESLTKDQAVLTFEHIHALENLAIQDCPGKVDLSHHLKAVKTGKTLDISYA
jgi:tRNA(Ile)-lysidine synthase